MPVLTEHFNIAVRNIDKLKPGMDLVPIIWQNVCRELHENESVPHLDLPLCSIWLNLVGIFKLRKHYLILPSRKIIP